MTLSAATVRALYSTVLGGGVLGDAIELAQTEIGASGFVWNDLPGGPSSLRNNGFSRQVSSSFRGVVFPDAHTSLANDPRVNFVIGRRDKLFVASEQLGSIFGKDSYHREFLEGTLGTRYTMGFAVSAIGHHHSSGLLGLHRMTSKGSFTEQEKLLANELLTSMREVLRLQFELSATRAAASVGESVLNTLGEAVFVTDKVLSLQWTNRLGETLLRQAKILHLLSGIVCAKNAWAKKLSSAVDDVLKRGAIRQIQIGLLDNQPILMTVAPCIDVGLVVASPLQNGSIVLRISRSVKVLEVADQARLIYGLTNSEALLAADLAAGKTVTEHSVIRGVKITTVRFHVRAILEKTSTRDLQSLSLLLGKLSA
jgi:DNA-binding CsgD family transcriptional regulator